jgi:hypothetical protein
MEIRLEVLEEMDGGRQADDVRRDIHKRFPEAVWERYGNGHKIFT